MWDQLVISSDKETCWMCSCIKKKFRSLTLLFLHGLPALHLFHFSDTEIHRGGAWFQNLKNFCFLKYVVLYSQGGGRDNYNHRLRKSWSLVWSIKTKHSHHKFTFIYTLHCEEQHCWLHNVLPKQGRRVRKSWARGTMWFYCTEASGRCNLSLFPT